MRMPTHGLWIPYSNGRRAHEERAVRLSIAVSRMCLRTRAEDRLRRRPTAAARAAGQCRGRHGRAQPR